MKRAAAPVVELVLAVTSPACGALPTPTPAPTEIPFGGNRASILPQDAAAARERISGGLAEPSWLPGGFQLIFVSFDALGQTADLCYEDGQHYVQIFEVKRGPGELGPTEPFDYGDRAPVGDTVKWSATPVGELDPGGTTYHGKLEDGRTVSLTTNLDADVVERILQSIYVRAPEDT